MRKLCWRLATAAAIAMVPIMPLHAEWQQATSPNFTVIGDMNAADLRKRTQELEQYNAMLRLVLGVKETTPVTIFVVNDIGDVQATLGGGGQGIAGFYTASAQRAFAVIPERINGAQRGFTPRLVLQHEYAHHMLLTNVKVFMPGWAQEGLAEMFATAKLEDDGSVTVGAPSEARASAYFGTNRWSVKRLLESDFNPPKGDEAIEKYSRGWAMAHYLWISGERPNQYTQFLAELNRTFDPVASGTKVFGDLDALTRELNSYLARGRFKTARFTADKLQTPQEVTIRPLSAGESAIINYRIASSMGVTEKTAGPLAERARRIAARYPDDVGVQMVMAEIEYDAKNDAAAEAAADRVLAAEPENLFGLVYKGRVAMRRAVAAKDPQLARQARSWLLRANRAHQDHPLPYMLYYDSFAAMGEKPNANAAAGLFRAMELVPQDTDLRIRAAMQLLRDGDVSNARLVLAPVAFVAEGSGENKALKFIRELSSATSATAALAKAEELKFGTANDWIAQPEDEDEEKDS